MRLPRLCALFLMAHFGAMISLAGCGPRQPSPAAKPAGAQQPTVKSGSSAPSPSKEPLPGFIVTDIEGEKEPQRLYSFTLRDADIREVLLAISKQSAFNIVPDQDVQGRVTVDLKDVSLSEALNTLTDLLGLTYRVKQNLIRVSRVIPETRIFSLQYVNLKRTGSTATSAQIATSAAGTVPGAPGVGASVGAGGGTSGQTTVTTSTETDLWENIETGVQKLLSPDGSLVVDRQGGNILVTDFPRNLERIGRYLETVEGSVQRQVLIEARIVEVTLTGGYKFGIDWAAIAEAGALTGATTIAPGKIFAQSLAPEGGDFQIGVTSTDFDALLTILSTQGEVDLLSSPKLATLNNQTAVIRSATDDVFFERRVIETFVDGTPRTTTEVTPRTVTVGVVLSVTPQISPNGSIVLHLRPTVTEKTGEAEFRDGATIFTAPILDVREADVVVNARDGQIVVIGGLMAERKIDDERKVPFLGDLPGIGRLFRSTDQDRKKTEIVILLSPTVMVGKKVDEITKRELERLNKTRGGSPW